MILAVDTGNCSALILQVEIHHDPVFIMHFLFSMIHHFVIFLVFLARIAQRGAPKEKFGA